MGNNNEGNFSPHWEGFRKTWWIVAIILFILIIISWLMGAYPEGKYCPPKVEEKVKVIPKAVVAPDTIAPLITLNGSSLTYLTTGDKYDEPGAKAMDVTDGSITVTTTGSVDTSKAGEYSIMYKVTDAAGNSTTETRKVIVTDPVDATAPTLTLLGAATATTLVGNSYTDPGATAMDDVDGEVKVVTTGKVDTQTAGDYILTYTATDKKGNSNSSTRAVTVTKPADTNAPVISLSGQSLIYQEVGGNFTDEGAIANDSTDGKVKVTTIGSVDPKKVGEYIIIYTAKDAAGNKATETRKVIITKPADTTAPVISLNSQTTVYMTVGDSYEDKGALATDNEDGSISVTTTGSVNTSKVGEYTLTYSATDSAGNKASSMRKVIVMKAKDAKAPIISLNSQATVYMTVGDSYIDKGALATDNEDGDVSVTSTGNVDTSKVGEYILTYSAIDAAGNKASSMRKVIVMKAKDANAPVITLNGPEVFNAIAGKGFVDPGATAADNEDGTVSIETTGNVDDKTPGEYIVTYSATDKAGNKASATRMVIITKPKVVVPKPVARLYYGNNRADNATDRNGSLDAVISYMKTSGNDGATAIVTGFHSPSGNPDYNRGLANRRANDIIARLKAAGIPSSRISIQQPSVTEGTGAPGEARRVEVYVR